jgi:large subunit ribosomal protein L29
MKKMAALKDLSITELQNKIHEMKRELFNLRFQKAKGELENVRRIRQVKADIARVLTRMREIQNG